MLRRLNDALREQEVPRPVYVNWVRESIVKEVLAQRPGQGAGHRAAATPRRRSSRSPPTWLEEIRGLGRRRRR